VSINPLRPYLLPWRDVALSVGDSVFEKLVPRRASETAVSNTVAIVNFAAIGDLFLWLGCAKALREHYTDAKIVLLGNHLWQGIAAALPYFDEVIGIEVRRFRNDLVYRYEMLSSLKGIGASTILHPAYTRQGYFADGEGLVRALPAKEKIGFSGEGAGWRHELGKRAYTKLLPAQSKELMELERNAEFMNNLGIPFRAAVPTFPKEVLPQREVKAGAYYVIAPGAGADKRKWPAGNFAALAEKIHAKTGLKGLVCGSPGERELAQSVIDQSAAPLENWAGRSSLLGYVRILSDAQLIVSNDTSAVHMAATLHVPSVCVMGGGHYERFAPYPSTVEDAHFGPLTVVHKMPCFKCNWACIYPIGSNEPAPCVANVELEKVWQACQVQLTNPHPAAI